MRVPRHGWAWSVADRLGWTRMDLEILLRNGRSAGSALGPITILRLRTVKLGKIILRPPRCSSTGPSNALRSSLAPGRPQLAEGGPFGLARVPARGLTRFRRLRRRPDQDFSRSWRPVNRRCAHRVVNGKDSSGNKDEGVLCSLDLYGSTETGCEARRSMNRCTTSGHHQAGLWQVVLMPAPNSVPSTCTKVRRPTVTSG